MEQATKISLAFINSLHVAHQKSWCDGHSAMQPLTAQDSRISSSRNSLCSLLFAVNLCNELIKAREIFVACSMAAHERVELQRQAAHWEAQFLLRSQCSSTCQSKVLNH